MPKEFREPFFKEPEKREIPKEIRIGIISDTQNLENPEEAIKKLVGEKLDLIIHIGDIYAGPMRDRLVQEGKKIFALKKGLIGGELTRAEEKEYQEIVSSKEFQEFIEKGDPEPRAYMKVKMLHNPEIEKEDIQIEEEKIENTLVALKNLGVPTKHISGNVDVGDSRRQNFIQTQEARLGIETYLKPDFVDLGESALIIWPYQNIDPKKEVEIRQFLDKKVEELAQKAKGKKQLILIAHEHLLKGPRDYGKLAQEAGFKQPRLPRLQPHSSVSHLIHLLCELSPESKISYVHGHLHDPRETIQAGIPYLEEEGGKFKFAVGMPHTEKHKEIDIIYFPHGKAGVLKITKEGVKVEEK